MTSSHGHFPAIRDAVTLKKKRVRGEKSIGGHSIADFSGRLSIFRVQLTISGKKMILGERLRDEHHAMASVKQHGLSGDHV